MAITVTSPTVQGFNFGERQEDIHLEVALPTLTQVIDAFLSFKKAQRLSPHTISDYSVTYRKIRNFIGDDPPFVAIRVEHVCDFMNSLTVSKKTALNAHVALSSIVALGG